MVLLHGVGLNADSWGAQIGALANLVGVHAFDMPGHGGSAMPDGMANLADFTDALTEAMASLGPPVYLAGHSLGALIALDMTVRYPHLVRAVAAINPVHRRSAAARAAVRGRAARLATKGGNDSSAPLARWFGNNLSCPEARACRAWLTAVEPGAYAAAYRAFALADSPDCAALSAITCSVLLLTGAEDPNSTPEMSEQLAACMPRGQSRIVEGAAHMVMMTHPEIVNAALIDFFGDPE